MEAERKLVAHVLAYVASASCKQFVVVCDVVVPLLLPIEPVLTQGAQEDNLLRVRKVRKPGPARDPISFPLRFMGGQNVLGRPVKAGNHNTGGVRAGGRAGVSLLRPQGHQVHGPLVLACLSTLACNDLLLNLPFSQALGYFFFRSHVSSASTSAQPPYTPFAMRRS